MQHPACRVPCSTRPRAAPPHTGWGMRDTQKWGVRGWFTQTGRARGTQKAGHGVLHAGGLRARGRAGGTRGRTRTRPRPLRGHGGRARGCPFLFPDGPSFARHPCTQTEGGTCRSAWVQGEGDAHSRASVRGARALSRVHGPSDRAPPTLQGLVHSGGHAPPPFARASPAVRRGGSGGAAFSAPRSRVKGGGEGAALSPPRRPNPCARLAQAGEGVGGTPSPGAGVVPRGPADPCPVGAKEGPPFVLKRGRAQGGAAGVPALAVLFEGGVPPPRAERGGKRAPPPSTRGVQGGAPTGGAQARATGQEGEGGGGRQRVEEGGGKRK
ncbi:hypothetical protein V8E53_004051 [Lactarius tabidus]